MNVLDLKSRYGYNRLKLAIDLIDECKEGKTLDIGCGDGILQQILPDRDFTGMDISLEVLNKAKKNNPSGNYVLASITGLPIMEGSMDAVAMIAVLGGISKDEESNVLREAGRVLNDDGCMIILVSQQRQPYSALVPDILFEKLEWRHFNAESLRQNIEANGFIIDKVIFAGGILCLFMDLFNYFWNWFWPRINRRLIGKPYIPSLPYLLMNKIEGLEFPVFHKKLQSFARYIYIVARKT